jgi:hypothetical protein
VNQFAPLARHIVVRQLDVASRTKKLKGDNVRTGIMTKIQKTVAIIGACARRTIIGDLYISKTKNFLYTLIESFIFVPRTMRVTLGIL